MSRRLRVLAAGILSIGTACRTAPSAFASTISFPDFSNVAGLTLNGAATAVNTVDGTVLRLTPAASFQSGSAFSTTQIALGAGSTFSTFFQFRISDPAGLAPADGFAFVLQTVDDGVGSTGGGLGFQGISPSVAVEFDTFDNAPAIPTDPNPNHVAVDTNGALNGPGVIVNGQSSCGSVATVTGTPNCMANGHLWSVWIDYDGANLRVALADNSNVRPANLVNQPINLAGIIGQTAFVGFTAATGGGFENHDIVTWSFVGEFAPIGVVPEPATVGLLAGGLAALVARRRHRGGYQPRHWRSV